MIFKQIDLDFDETGLLPISAHEHILISQVIGQLSKNPLAEILSNYVPFCSAGLVNSSP